jgi:membrane-bound ClpP family serine protease
MVCGHCGTDIKPGFKTCAACGAMYLQQLGCLGRLFTLLGVLLLVLGGMLVFFVANGPKNQALGLVDMSLILGGAVMLLIAKKTASYKWFRKL